MSEYSISHDHRVGMPSGIPAGGFRPVAIACHTPEWAEGDVKGLIDYFVREAARRNASYNYALSQRPDGGLHVTCMVGNPTTGAHDRYAHSMNPRPTTANPPGPWRNPPLARVAKALGPHHWNPNVFSIGWSLMGFTASTPPKRIANPKFMAGLAQFLLDQHKQFPTLRGNATGNPIDSLFNHGEGQTNRSDWGTIMRPALEAALKSLTPTPPPPPPTEEDDVPITRPPRVFEELPAGARAVLEANREYNAFQFLGMGPDGKPLLRRFNGLRYATSTAARAISRVGFEPGDAPGWLYSDTVWMPEHGFQVCVWWSKSPRPEPALITPPMPPSGVPAEEHEAAVKAAREGGIKDAAANAAATK